MQKLLAHIYFPIDSTISTNVAIVPRPGDVMHSISMLGRYTLIFFTWISIRSQFAVSAGNEGLSGLPVGDQEAEQVLLQLLMASTSETHNLIGNHCTSGKPRLLLAQLLQAPVYALHSRQSSGFRHGQTTLQANISPVTTCCNNTLRSTPSIAKKTTLRYQRLAFST